MNGEAVREVGEPDSTLTTSKQKKRDCGIERKPVFLKRKYVGGKRVHVDKS